MTRSLFVLTAISATIWAAPVHAIWNRTESIEWHTNVSDAIVTATVSGVKAEEPLNEYWDSQTVKYKLTDALKGDAPPDLTFRQDYAKDAKHHGKDNIFGVRPLKVGDKVLLFFGRREPNEQLELAFWVNLTNPDTRRTNHAAYDNDCKWLGKGALVVDLVKKRVAKEDPKRRTRARGVILGFSDAGEGNEGLVWEFVRTADPDFRIFIVERLKGDTASWAIYNLVSYPGKDTVELIRPFLKDPTTHIDSSNPARKVTSYPVRQMAYAALKLLGESPNKPDGFHENGTSWQIDTGFEQRSYFPFGDWKRIDQ